MRVVGYVRVSSVEQASSGLGLGAQEAAIRAEAARRGWNVIEILRDEGASGKALSGRPGLAEALSRIEAEEAGSLVVSRLDRLSRSLLDFAAIMERSRQGGWAVVCLDLGVDTSTPSGEMMASVLASFAQYERRLISARTKEALAVKRAQGVRLGRPPEFDPVLRERILSLHRSGQTLTEISRILEREGIRGPRGGLLDPSGVRRIVRSKSAA